MKVTTETPEGFAPVTLHITIETEEELVQLYHRLNIAFASIVASPEYEDRMVPANMKDSHLPVFYDAVYDLVEARNISGCFR